jgi:hypothetical protein
VQRCSHLPGPHRTGQQTLADKMSQETGLSIAGTKQSGQDVRSQNVTVRDMLSFGRLKLAQKLAHSSRAAGEGGRGGGGGRAGQGHGAGTGALKHKRGGR